MFIGIDLGTSAVKAILMNRDGRVSASATAPLLISRPRPLWSEQDPEEWWTATLTALRALLSQARDQGISPGRIEAIGLTGQMHGATLLDRRGEVLRPAMLWNDGRAGAQCALLEQREPRTRAITGNPAMAGFTAPKVLWMADHEPVLFQRIDKVLLPKDYLRFRLTGDFATDMSDAAGTLWLDVGARDWSDAMLSATGLSRAQMPTLHEGNKVTGRLLPQVASNLGIPPVPVAAGAGDNAAGAIGTGIIRPGQAMLSLGTSGVYFVATDRFLSNPAGTVHSFCHALPATWHLMSVMLSAASCLDFTVRIAGFADVTELLAAASERGLSAESPLFLPYLTGERTPHNNPAATAGFFGLTAGHDRADLAAATLEGVGLGLLDGIDALETVAPPPGDITLIGGGSKSPLWARMLADITGRTLIRRAGGDVGPALGAARLAHLALAPERTPDDICPVPDALAIHQPDPDRAAWYRDLRRPRFRALFQRLEPMFVPPAES